LYRYNITYKTTPHNYKSLHFGVQYGEKENMMRNRN